MFLYEMSWDGLKALAKAIKEDPLGQAMKLHGIKLSASHRRRKFMDNTKLVGAFADARADYLVCDRHTDPLRKAELEARCNGLAEEIVVAGDTLRCFAAKKGSKIYVASSWRNPHQPRIVRMLREDGHQVYDFRNPVEGDRGFSWSEIDENWEDWTQEEYLKALSHRKAQEGFDHDMAAMLWADAGVLLLGAGASAHLELGWFCGREDKDAYILLDTPYVDKKMVGVLRARGHTLRPDPCSACFDTQVCRLTTEELRKEAVRYTEPRPELMYKMADGVFSTYQEILGAIG